MPKFREIEERVKGFLNTKKDQDVADALGYQTIGAWYAIKSRGSIPYERLLKFSLTHDIDSIWLIYGDKSGKEIIPRELINTVNKDEHYTIPYFGEVTASCGAGAVNDSTFQEWLLLPKNRYTLENNLEAIKAAGDSMIPLIKENSIIIFKRVQHIDHIRNSQVYIYRYEEELYVKMLIEDISDKNKIKAVSLNNQYPIYKIEANKIDIIGEFITTI
jgi:SOS-response transcriptional repressor LexA